MSNFYLALTVLLTSGISFNFNYSLVHLFRSLFFPLVTFNPVGLLILDTLILYAIGFAMSHIFIKSIKLKTLITTKNSFSIAILACVLLVAIPTMVVDYTLLKQCLIEDVYYALRFIKNVSFMTLLLLLIMQISHLQFSDKASVFKDI